MIFIVVCNHAHSDEFNELHYSVIMWWDKDTAISTSYWHNVQMAFCSQHGHLHLMHKEFQTKTSAQLQKQLDVCCHSNTNSRRLKARCILFLCVLRRPGAEMCVLYCMCVVCTCFHAFSLVWLALCAVHWGSEELRSPCQVIAVEHAQLMRCLETRAQTESFLQYV